MVLNLYCYIESHLQALEWSCEVLTMRVRMNQFTVMA